MDSEMKPIADEICASCGEPIDVQPGVTFVASTDGKVWHYGCAPSRNRESSSTPDPAIVKLREALEKVANWREDCHRYDADMGHELRDFSNEDWDMIEAHAFDVLAALSPSQQDKRL